MVMVWGRTINHRPRRDRGGRTWAELIDDKPTAEEFEQAQTTLEQLAKRQEQARKTRAARQDPIVRGYVANSLNHLLLDDPKGYFLTAIAGYPLEAIAEAVAIFKGRKHSGTLPDGVDVRYLLGITRNVAQDREAWAIMDALWEERERARDSTLEYLWKQRDDIFTRFSRPENRVSAFVDKALACDVLPQRHFWLTIAASTISSLSPSLWEELYKRAGQRIQASYKTSYRERQAAIRYLASKVLPLC